MVACGVAIRTTAAEGRHHVASEDLIKGFTVYSGDAHAAALYDEYVRHVCASCFQISREGFTRSCTACKRVFYCSKRCGAEHLVHDVPGAIRHSLTCPALQRLGCLEEQGSAIHARLIIEVIARRWQLILQQQEDELFSLVSHEPASGWIHCDESESWCEGLRAAISACEWAKCVPAHWLTDDAFLETVAKIDVNGFDCKTHLTGGESIGIALYLGGATLFNHSCAPNCTVAHTMPSLHITTLHPIPRGTPLTIAYVDVHADRGTRRQRLRTDYGFECMCLRCVTGDADYPQSPHHALNSMALGQSQMRMVVMMPMAVLIVATLACTIFASI